MANHCESPYLASIENRRIAKPVLSFSRRLLIKDENEVNTNVIRRVSLKRSDTSAMSPSVLGLANKKCRMTPVRQCAINKNVVNIPSSIPVAQPKTENVEKSPTKLKESEAKIMKAVQISEQDPDLIGDFSQQYALPVCLGKHSDLKTITPETLAALLRGQYKNIIDNHTIIDGRYPYEFKGGHIIGAKNIYNKSMLLSELLDNQQENIDANKDGKRNRHILIFHCEFSSERGPSLLRFLRNKDREYNLSRYPCLFHPEIYILDGGYKAFYEKFKELCVPQNYLPMLSKDHKEEMRQFRNKNKSSKA
ncbi:M-phase inducer phosphatase-like [Tetranychus urticae]|uniref:M-phase inducer phosphatase n=1 Tax=Tetranychus urticae TaxID=32264 RepID=T1L469_TETUR|nr:M-phase inducer phosphatase-like [Tetranychus urticae]